MIRSIKIKLASIVALLCIGLIIMVLSPSATTPALAAKKPTRTPTPTATATRTPTPAPIPSPTTTPAPDFFLDFSPYPMNQLGYVIRGGLADCSICLKNWEPRYIDNTSQGCFYDSNYLKFVSLNGFEGILSIGITNLPQGVTSNTATSVFLPRGQTVLIPFDLNAANDAPLSFRLVLVQAIVQGGSLQHSIYQEIHVVDQMPPCQ